MNAGYGPIVTSSEPSSASRREIDGLVLEERVGDGSPPAVVIVHGGMDRASSFGRVVRLLPEVPLVRYDRRGYGRSRPGTAAELDRHVRDLLTVLPEGPVVVFGHSIGGTIALATAAAHPARIRALAVFESPSPWSRRPHDERRTGLEGLGPDEAAERFMVRMVGERVWRRLPAATRDARRREGPALLADMGFAEAASGLDPSSIEIPVLVGYGTRSGDARREEAEQLAAVLPDAELVAIEGAVHGVHLGDPAATADLIRRLRRMGEGS